MSGSVLGDYDKRYNMRVLKFYTTHFAKVSMDHSALPASPVSTETRRENVQVMTKEQLNLIEKKM